MSVIRPRERYRVLWTSVVFAAMVSASSPSTADTPGTDAICMISVAPFGRGEMPLADLEDKLASVLGRSFVRESDKFFAQATCPPDKVCDVVSMKRLEDDTNIFRYRVMLRYGAADESHQAHEQLSGTLKCSLGFTEGQCATIAQFKTATALIDHFKRCHQEHKVDRCAILDLH